MEQSSGSSACTSEPERKRILIYCRVSTVAQVSGHSLEVQMKRCKEYCRSKGHKAIRYFNDVCSGNIPLEDRTGFRGILNHLRNHEAEGICIAHVDRLTRDASELRQTTNLFNKKNWLFLCMEPDLDITNPMQCVQLNIMGAVAQLERAQISKRTKDVLDALKKEGRITGRTPLGKKIVISESGVKYLLDNPTELAIIERVKALCESKEVKYTLKAITKKLGEEGHVNRKGTTEWSVGQVSSIINYIKKQDREEEEECSSSEYEG